MSPFYNDIAHVFGGLFVLAGAGGLVRNRVLFFLVLGLLSLVTFPLLPLEFCDWNDQRRMGTRIPPRYMNLVRIEEQRSVEFGVGLSAAHSSRATTQVDVTIMSFPTGGIAQREISASNFPQPNCPIVRSAPGFLVSAGNGSRALAVLST